LRMEGGKLVWGCHGRGLVYSTVWALKTAVAGYCMKKEVVTIW